MATIPSNKRQRTAEQSLHISNLPDGILTHAASYLATPSRALFAVAMTAPTKSWAQDNFGISRHQQTVASILSSGVWDVLDFGDIEKSLTEKLTDDDVHAVLKCISAQDVLKKLRLTGCVYITGRSLAPLRGSTIIEHIDLSLAKQYESPKLNPEPMISEEVVIPILDSIIATNGNLKMIVFPKKWREAKTDRFAQFLANYNQLLESRGPKCLKCKLCLIAEGEYRMIERTERSVHYGTHNYCCYKCMDHFCYDCNDNIDGPLHVCVMCEKDYCVDCVAFKGGHCKGCSPVKTHGHIAGNDAESIDDDDFF